ncbi:hypothetical protein AMJ87_09200 [candidate division WOR_3 bacterium SM23_60]|uniref:Nickel insertion protein n=1 Tax=candidate division WOR_3 bacterium SM23_60 TaxID=1703780 RepID=A0A0S8GC61_UNCW3|nr:MAG: hypothetical protein AMJ87_09200 [candidate division WOR_3 bacterium SM23_60]
MKVLYFDPILGASGDMIIAALIDCGTPQTFLQEKLTFVPGCTMKVKRVQRYGVSARSVQFTINPEIREKDFLPLIKRSTLPTHVKQQATTIINRIFTAEKKVHRAKKLHLHEMADADTLLDIVGALLAIDYLKVDRVYSKPLKAGQGFIKTQEGNMPAFNFATAELLKGSPVDFVPIAGELTTPTAAAIVSTIAAFETNLTLTRIHSVGLSTGTHIFKDYPNLLRVFVGEIDDVHKDACTVIETNIDDMNPQDYELLIEKLYSAGALEVFLTSTLMKNSRPGVLLTVLCAEHMHRISTIIFEETTTLGIRIHHVPRLIMQREIIAVQTPLGKVRIKKARLHSIRKFSLEYEDVKHIAQKHKLPIPTVRRKLLTYVDEKHGDSPVKGSSR